MDIEELYQELIIEHYKQPRHRGELEDSTSSSKLFNPLCGDEIEVQVQLRDDQVENISFLGKGCAISQAAASMMTEVCLGKTRIEAAKLIDIITRMLKKEASQEELVQIGDAQALSGVADFPARIRCAALAWEALGQCLKKEDD